MEVTDDSEAKEVEGKMKGGWGLGGRIERKSGTEPASNEDMDRRRKSSGRRWWTDAKQERGCTVTSWRIDSHPHSVPSESITRE